MVAGKNALSGSYKETVISNGIGKGVNAITDNYAEITSQYKSIFDTDAFNKLTIVKTDLKTQEATSYISRKMRDLSINIGTNHVSTDTADKAYQLFTGSYLTSLPPFQAKLEYSNETNEIFYSFNQNIKGYRIEINEYEDKAILQKALSSAFISDIQGVESGTIDPETIIKRYGSHIVAAAYFGGRIECTYHYAGNNKSVQAGEEPNYGSKMSSILSSYLTKAAGFTGSLDFTSALGFSNENSYEQFHAMAVGGKTISMSSESEFTANYPSWIESFNNTTEYDVLSDLPRNSLVSIWSLVNDSYPTAAGKIKAQFDSDASTAYTSFLDKYEALEYTYGEKTFEPRVGNCKLDNGYDSNSPETNKATALNEIDPHIADFRLNDVAQKDGENIKMGFDDFNITLKMRQDTTNISLTGYSGSTATTASLSSDTTKMKDVKGVNYSSSEDQTAAVGYGACFVNISYANGLTIPKNKGNIFQGIRTVGNGPVILEKSDLLEEVKVTSIVVTLVYEILTKYPTAFGAQGSTYTNWRQEETFLFQ